MKTERNGSFTHPKRVLHIVPGMHWGGLETWVCRVAREMATLEIRFDILVPFDKVEDEFVDQMAAMHATVFRAASFTQPFAFMRDIRRTLRDRGPYDAVHTHMCAFNAVAAVIGRISGVPKIVAHSHIDLRSQTHSFLKTSARHLSAQYLAHYGVKRIACSSAAASSQYRDIPGLEKCLIMPCGVDSQMFEQAAALGLRSQLGLAPATSVITHIGRLDHQKNHLFLLRIFAAALKKHPDLHLLLIGNGPLESKIRAEIGRLGIGAKTSLLGVRRDTNRLLLEATDVFLFPSLFEGLPIALLEAQAAALPCIISDSISPEAVIIPELVQSLSLQAAPEIWADRLIEALDSPKSIDPSHALARMRDRRLTVRANAEQLALTYCSN